MQNRLGDYFSRETEGQAEGDRQRNRGEMEEINRGKEKQMGDREGDREGGGRQT